MRLIDADRLSEAIYDNVSAPYEEAVCAKEDCLTEIYAAPTVDAVPVVRCRECAHWKHKENVGCTDFVKVCEYGRYMVGANGYCVYGERKEGAE